MLATQVTCLPIIYGHSAFRPELQQKGSPTRFCLFSDATAQFAPLTLELLPLTSNESTATHMFSLRSSRNPNILLRRLEFGQVFSFGTTFEHCYLICGYHLFSGFPLSVRHLITLISLFNFRNFLMTLSLQESQSTAEHLYE